MTAATILVAVALAKAVLDFLATRPNGKRAPSPSGVEEADQNDGFNYAARVEDHPTGNLPSEEYSSSAGSRQAFGDFRDPDEYYSHQHEHCGMTSSSDDGPSS